MLGEAQVVQTKVTEHLETDGQKTLTKMQLG